MVSEYGNFLTLTDKNITWTSSNSNVATVDWQGKVVAKGVGTATITARTNDGGYTATCEVVVEPVKVTSVNLNTTSKTLKLGDQYLLIATVEPINATDKRVVWSSSNESVATVNENGIVNAVGTGSATVTAKTVDGNFTVSCEITVESPVDQPISISITKQTAAVNKIIEVFVSLNHIPNNGVVAADFSISYDSTKLQVINVVPGEIILDSRDFDYQVINNQINFLFADESENESRAITQNGKFAKLTFKVLDVEQVGLYSIEIVKVGNFVSPLLTKYEYVKDNGYVDTFKYGDVNGDGRTASDDYLLIKNHILGRISSFNFKYGFVSGDVSLDNEITSLDYIAIKKYLLGKIPILPVQ